MSPARGLDMSELFEQWQAGMLELVQDSDKFLEEYSESRFRPKWIKLARRWMQNRSLKEFARKKRLSFSRIAKAFIEHWKNEERRKALNTITKGKGVPTNRLYHRPPSD